MIYFGEDSLFYFDSGRNDQLADLIKEVYSNPEAVKYKTENAYRDYMKVNWDIMKERFLKLINEIS